MIGLSVWEIALLVAVALVFVRPDNLPTLMRKLGGLYGRARDSVSSVNREIRTFDETSYHGPNDAATQWRGKPLEGTRRRQHKE